MKYDVCALQSVIPLLAVLLLAFPPLAALAADPVIPGAGSILQQIQPLTPPFPSSIGTGLTIEQEGGAKLSPTTPFLVKTIKITGNTVFETKTLHALVADVEGQSRSLSQLAELAARITDYYHSQGYPLARAFIPAQAIRDGGVDINVTEARYGKIKLDNSSRVSDVLLQDTLAFLQGGQVIGQLDMDHALLLISDIPGVVVNATMNPGDAVGTSDLLVNTTPGPVVSGNLALDNNGNRFTGRERIGGTVNFNNPLRHGDLLSVSGLSSGSGMNYGRIAYDFLLNGRGTRMGGSWTALRYALGAPLASINAHGTAQVASLWAKHPLVRSQVVNLYGQIQYDRMQLRDHVDSSTIRTDRHLDNWTASFAGDVRDAFLAGAVSSWNLGWTSGRVNFDDTAAQLADAATVKTKGAFSKVNASLVRLQGLNLNNALNLAFSGQWANTNLDASQKMTAGGPYTVRGYDTGAVSGDAGYFASVELRHDMGSAWSGQVQAVAFIDSAHVTVNKTPLTSATNSATLSGVGVGINWTGLNQWSAKTYIAAPMGAIPALVGTTNSARAWVEISMKF